MIEIAIIAVICVMLLLHIRAANFQRAFLIALAAHRGTAKVPDLIMPMEMVLNRSVNIGLVYALIDRLEERKMVVTWTTQGGMDRSHAPELVVQAITPKVP